MQQPLAAQVLFIFFIAHPIQHFVICMLHLLQGFFFFYKSQFFLLQACFFFGNTGFQFYAFIYLLLLLMVKVFVGNIKTFQCSFGKLYTNFFVFFFYFKILFCFFCLAL